MIRRPNRTPEEVADRHRKAIRLSTNRREWRAVQLYDRIREKNPSLFAQLICQAELGIPFGDSNLVLFAENRDRPDGVVPSKPSAHCYLAKLILERMAGSRPAMAGLYVSLAAWIESDAEFDLTSFSWARYGLDVLPFKSTVGRHDLYVTKVRWKFFEEATERLNWSIMKAARMVYRGVPLFQTANSGNDTRPVPEDSREYIYLRERGRRGEYTTESTLPDWATNYVVKLDHIKAHDAIFFSDWDLSHEELELRRSILMAQCGTPGKSEPRSWPWGNHETKLLRSLAAAAREWWTTYDSDDPATAPTNDQVTSWLESQGESKRVAEVMAQILRADGLPPGPRR